MENEGPSVVISKLNTIDFKTFSGKVDVDFDDGKGNGKSVTAKLVIKKTRLSGCRQVCWDLRAYGL
ncbi:DUF4292 domain-containing protein [Niabella sp. W65]|nr:DUF4292 domain-containing protein [Niabella sp. W65]MCH7362260.1 DUF4292 domain-containing protein [Niabella sp. W65]